MLHLHRRPFFHGLDADVGRIADHGIEAGSLAYENLWKLGLPVKDVDTIPFLLIHQTQILLIVEVRADEGVAAFDVVTQIGQGAFVEHGHLAAQRILRFIFQHLEQQGELGHFHRLLVNIHAVDVIEQDAFFLRRGQPPFAF